MTPPPPGVDQLAAMVKHIHARVLADRGASATLRRSIGRRLNDVPAALPVIALWLPTDPDPHADTAVLMTAALAARHGEVDAGGSRISLGTALGGVTDGPANLDRRLLAACRAPADSLARRHLPDLVKIVASAGRHLDLAYLGAQTAAWGHTRQQTQRQWLRDFYRTQTPTPTASEDKDEPA